MKFFLKHPYSCAVILIWLIVFLVQQKADLTTHFSNRGLSIIGREYYRFATALFLHSNLLHVMVNAVTIYWIGQYLEPQINPFVLLVFSVAIGVITEAAFSAVFRNAIGTGGSPMIFALIGLIAALQFRRECLVPFQLGTWYGNWITGYAILSNLPVFSDSFTSTLFIHLLPLLLGCLAGYWMPII